MAKLFKVSSSQNQPGQTGLRTAFQRRQAEGTLAAPTGLKAAFQRRQAEGTLAALTGLKTAFQRRQAEGTLTAPTGLKAVFERRQAQGAATELKEKADTGQVALTKSVSFSDKVQKIIIERCDNDTDSLSSQDSL
ncbi:hypothetical protein AV903_21675 [Erwinia tracheiphila]|uniref:Uncharacterized protein n=1 Tax=Erwinia tracheiphila TaxID=65700 RepID=A0A345CX51_9GAMM|nr:hypothetical protein AV903_21675 [Erwinia tracheiphila]